MNKFVFSTVPPKCWQVFCSRQGSLFYNVEWQKMLEKSFSSNTLYGWDGKHETGIVITIFKIGPFRIGYVGFPAGGTLGRQPLTDESIIGLRETLLPTTLHLLRIPVSAFGEKVVLDLDAVTVPETAIINLQEWQLLQMPKLNRDIKKANRSGLEVIDASPVPSHGKKCFQLYKDTIQRHDGNLRYNQNYFDALIQLSDNQPNLRCLLALLNDQIAGFVVIALHGKTAYYLHGAMDLSLRRYCTSDRLMYEAIVWAKDNRMNCFNFMASPSGLLLKFKKQLIFL